MNFENKSKSVEDDSKIAPVPTFCCFSICDVCVLRCQMCQKWKEDIYIKPWQKIMKFEDWKKAAVSLREFAPDNLIINFGGGEATTVPWLFDLISFCHDLKFKTNIASNGFLIDEVMVEKMAVSGLDYITISLDSIDENTHDKLRGVKGVYQNVLRAIDLIKKHAPHIKICICAILMDPTLEGIPALVEWAQKNEKIDLVYLMVLMQPNNTLHDPLWYEKEFKSLWPQDYKKAELVLDTLIDFTRKKYKICNSEEHIMAFKTYFFDPQRYVKKNACHIDRAVHISSVGDLFMCYRKEPLGDVRDTQVSELWRSQLAVQIRRDIKKCRENCHFLLNCHFQE